MRSRETEVKTVCLRFAKLIACDNEDIGTYAKLVDDRNVSAHANGNIFLREQGSLEGEYADPIDQIREVLVHENYVSRKDIDICVAYDLSAFAVREHAEAISDPHQPLAEKNVGVTNAADLF